LGEPSKGIALLAERTDLNIQHPALVEVGKILLPPLHIKLGLMKNFVKAMDRTSLKLSDTCMKNPIDSAKQRLKRGLCEYSHYSRALQTSKFKDDRLNNLLQGDVTLARTAFRICPTNFFGDLRAENYKELLEDMLVQYHKFGCNMPLCL